MTWNYRIILHDIDPDPERHWYGLHEVFYDDDGKMAWTIDPTTFSCDKDEGADGITASLEQALKTLRDPAYPVLLESETAGKKGK